MRDEVRLYHDEGNTSMFVLLEKGRCSIIATCAGSRRTAEAKFFRSELVERVEGHDYFVMNVYSGTVWEYTQQTSPRPWTCISQSEIRDDC